MPERKSPLQEREEKQRRESVERKQPALNLSVQQNIRTPARNLPKTSSSSGIKRSLSLSETSIFTTGDIVSPLFDGKTEKTNT